MGSDSRDPSGFFKTVFEGDVNFDAIRFLTEVEAQFKSEDLVSEVRWRLEALNEITALPEMGDASEALRDRLTQIFTGGGDAQVVLRRLKELTEIQGPNGEAINLRSFLKRERRVFSEQEYRQILRKKIGNTHTHVVNLIAYYPEAEKDLHKLSVTLKGLVGKIKDPSVTTASIKKMEDNVRATTPFQLYEDLKERFLREWLARFADLGDKSLEDLDPGEIQRMIQEHQRHQMTQLLKTRIKLVETDMTNHLGLHDTLEARFGSDDFWKGANVAAKTGFIKWVMDVVQAFGMLRGQRYAFFQSEEDKELYLLFGLGISHLPELSDEPIRMVPYLKPFTRKGTYLLEIRKRDIGDTEDYHHELLHYTLPFLFAFDQMKEFDIRKELTSFFTSRY